MKQRPSQLRPAVSHLISQSLLVVDLLLAQRDAALLLQEVLSGCRLGRIQFLHIGSRYKSLTVIDFHLPPVLEVKKIHKAITVRISSSTKNAGQLNAANQRLLLTQGNQ